MPTDEEYLRRAIRLAMNGRGSVEPNPMVGCVLVKNDRIIGEGIHAQFGGPHAEPTALSSCTEDPAGATAYVTLEPCCHLNKKTPPCAPRLIAAKLARVVVGCLDPNPDVDGKGVRMLRDAGIQVDGPLLENEAKQLLAPFIAVTVHKRPYVTLKWAQSADSKIAGPGGRRVQISNVASMRLVHQLRGRSDGIMVGINTVINDDPQLLPHGVENLSQHTRYVLDSQLRLPIDSQLVRTAKEDWVTVYVSWFSLGQNDNWKPLEANGVNVTGADTDQTNRIDLRKLFAENPCHFNDANLLVEPGPTLAASFFEANLCDRLWVFRSPNSIGDGIPAAAVPESFVKTGELNLDGDVLSEYLNPASPVFFAAVPSADFVLASERGTGGRFASGY